MFTKNPEGFFAGTTPKASEIYDVKSPAYKAVKFHPYISDTYYLTASGPVADFIVFTFWEGRYPDMKTSNVFNEKVKEEMLSVKYLPEVTLR